MKFFLFPVEYNQTILKTEHVNILPKCKIRALQLLFLATGELLCCHSNAEGSTFSTQYIINVEIPWSQGGEEARQIEKAAARRKKIPISGCTVFGLRKVMGNP